MAGPDGERPERPEPPVLSVVIVGINETEMLATCLESLAPGLEGLTYEAFYVDNGSTEPTCAMVAERFPEVRVIENGANLGFAAANNRGLAESSGRHVLLLNNDARLVPGEIPRLVEFLESSADIGAVGCRLVGEDGRSQHSVHPFPDLGTELFNRSLLSRLFPGRYPSKRTTLEEPTDVPAVLGACVLVRREVLGVVGPLDPGYFFYIEETDWCYRMHLAGFRVVYHPGVRTVHLVGSSVARFRGRAKVELYRSRYRFFRKFRSPLERFLLDVGLFGRLILQSVGLALVAIVTLGFVRRAWTRSMTYFYVLGWHMVGMPDGWGIAPVGEKGAGATPTIPTPGTPSATSRDES